MSRFIKISLALLIILVLNLEALPAPAVNYSAYQQKSGGDTTITVGSITGIASGDRIGVKLDTGLYHFTTVRGALRQHRDPATLPGSGVVATSGNAVVANLWKAMPNL